MKKTNATKYITPKKEDLERRFKEYNEMYFDNMLPPCKFRLSTSIVSACYNQNYSWITVSKNIYWTDESLKIVLIHEMVHHYVSKVLKKDPMFAHGRTFNKACNMLQKKYGLKVKLYQTPYPWLKGEKKPTLLKKALVKCFWYVFRI